MDWQPFYLNHNTPEEGEDMYEHLAGKYGVDKARQFTQPNNPLDKAGAKVGLTFNPARRIIRTRDSHRLVEWCKEVAPESEDALMNVEFNAYFTEAKDLSRHAELLECASACGLDAAACKEMLESDRYTREVDAKAKSWSRQGVSGVPFFIIHPTSGAQPVAFSGAQPPELMAEILTEQMGG
jgi:predicted DsbA family dithiol-disulfide isomerase